MQRNRPEGYNMPAKGDQFGDPTRRDTLSRLGDTLCDLRKRVGMTQEKAAEKVLVSTQTIGNWEAGRHGPDPTKLQALAQLWQVSETKKSIQTRKRASYQSGATASKSTSRPQTSAIGPRVDPSHGSLQHRIALNHHPGSRTRRHQPHQG